MPDDVNVITPISLAKMLGESAQMLMSARESCRPCTSIDVPARLGLKATTVEYILGVLCKAPNFRLVVKKACLLVGRYFWFTRKGPLQDPTRRHKNFEGLLAMVGPRLHLTCLMECVVQCGR